MKRKAVLIIHGFAGGVYDEEALSIYLELNNFDTYTFTLPGHDRTLFNKVKKEDWINSCESHLQKLIDNGYKDISVIGHSMGGVLATYLAVHHKEVKRLVLAAPAFKYFKEYGKEEVLSRLVQFPKSVLKEFMDLVSESQLLPSLIDVPTLIVQGSADIVVPLKSSEALYDEIKSKKKKIIVLDNVTHDIFRSSEVDSLCIKIKDFLNDKD